MRTKLKRILSTVLACVMLISLLPATALAVDSGNDSIVSTGGNGVEITKTATPNGDGTYRIEMDAYVKGSVQAASGTPLDIVLVLDQSGSMKGKYLRNLKTAVTNFISSIQKNAAAYNLDHKVAIVGFASNEDDGTSGNAGYTISPGSSKDNWINTGLFVNGTLKNYGAASTTTYTYEEVFASDLDRDAETNTYFVLKEGNYVAITYGILKNQWYYTYGGRITYIVPKTSAEASEGEQVYIRTSNITQTLILTAQDYQNALVSVNDNGKVTASITTAINNLAASGGTRSSYGMEMAKQVFANNPIVEGSNRQRIVVFFTDGKPGTESSVNTDEANATIANAYAVKQTYGAPVYSIGLYSNAGIDVTNFMNYVSSNYPNAQSMTNAGSKVDKENAVYYQTTSDSSALNDIFQNIAESIQPSVTVDSNSILTDTVSTYFVPSGVTTDGAGKITNGVTVYKVPAAGNGSTPTWGNKIDITNQVTVTRSDKTINVTGFDYSADENLVVQKKGTWQGNKLVLAFNITTDTSYTGWQKGTNNYPTNDTDSSKAGLTYGLGSTLLSASPKAPVTAYSVTYNENGSTSGTVPTSDTYYLAGTDVAVSGNTGNLTKTGYTFNGWNTQADGNGTAYAADGKISSIGANIDLYAQWKKDDSQTKDLSYTVEYYKDGVKVDADTQTEKASVWVNDPDTLTVAKDSINTTDKYAGYVFKATDPAEIPGTIENGGVIKVYYVTKNASVYVTKVVTSVTDSDGKPYDTKDTAKVGDTITWTITVTNKGNVPQTLTLTDILSNEQSVTIKDATDKAVTAPATITLGVDETLTYTATYTVQIGDSGDTLVNTAILKDGDTPKDEDTAPGVKIDPAVTVDKTVDKTTASVGDKLTYTITVTNNANITLENIVVTDEMLGMTGNNVVTIASLDAGKAWTQDYTYTVQSSDAGKTLVNTAIASIGEQELGKDSSDGTNIRKPYIPPVKPSKPVLNTEDHVAYIIGYEDGTVKPNNNITRAEVATIFFRLLSDDSRAEFWSQTNSYSDVALTNWFNNAVSTLSNAGVITGYPDDTFKPNASITRAEFAAIAARFSDAEATSTCSFTDVPADHWAASSIALAEELGWITGYEDGTFHPDQAITRAEAMTLINRVLERAVDRDHMLADMVTWTDNRPGSWYYEAVQEATNSHEYTRTGVYVPSQSFCYENWVEILEAPDWAALENTWSTANGQ